MSNIQYKTEPHHFIPCGKKTRIPNQYCINCGLIYLKNELTEWAVRQGCNYKEHVSYKNKLAITNPFKD